jgi:cytochrome c nitrite reductase small subunit
MNEQYAGWLKGSHRQAAVCNDCHTPPGLIPKYTTKALNGFFHSYAFTTGWFPDVIRITERNRNVTERACLKCHADVVSAISHSPGDPSCLRCHSSVGHQ